MKLKRETQIGLISMAVIYVLANVVKLFSYPDKSWQWHVITMLGAIPFIFFFGWVVRSVDRFLDKRLPFEKNIPLRIAVQILLTFSIIITIRTIGFLIFQHYFFNRLGIHVTREVMVLGTFTGFLAVSVLTLSIFGYHFVIRWKQGEVRNERLQREKAQVHYDNLKNQLNPHFLFNSLTSLNSLIFENPQLASDFLQQLSKVYRYLLDHKERNLVPVTTEAKFVAHYVNLLKTRFDGALSVEFNVEADVSDKEIAPVTLQVLIENAIKHNVTQKDKPLHIKIYNEGGNYLVVENNLQKKSFIEHSTKQGLTNLKNMYKYITDTEIVVEQDEKKFAVKIPLLEP
jgi:two-component system LytT family sensor kinase